MTPGERARQRAEWEAAVQRRDPYAVTAALFGVERGEWVMYTPAELGIGDGRQSFVDGGGTS